MVPGGALVSLGDLFRRHDLHIGDGARHEEFQESERAPGLAGERRLDRLRRQAVFGGGGGRVGIFELVVHGPTVLDDHRAGDRLGDQTVIRKDATPGGRDHDVNVREMAVNAGPAAGLGGTETQYMLEEHQTVRRGVRTQILVAGPLSKRADFVVGLARALKVEDGARRQRQPPPGDRNDVVAHPRCLRHHLRLHHRERQRRFGSRRA